MVFRTIATLVLPIAVVALIGGCNRPANGGSESLQTDSNEERIVSLVPSATELIYAFGRGDDLVARSTHCNYPSEVEALPSVGSGLEPDLERILALEPTLVVASALQSYFPGIEALEDAGVEVLLLPDDSMDEVRESMLTLGRRLDRAERAEEIVGEIDAEIERIRSEVADAEHPKVLVAVATDPIYAVGPDSRLGELLPTVGGDNVVERGDWVQLDREALIAGQPEVIVDTTGNAEPEVWGRFVDVPAVAG